MPAQHKHHPVFGRYRLKGGKLRFRSSDALLVQQALQARAADREFTVCLTSGDKDVTGKVVCVDLVEGKKPAQWEIGMRV
jgi:hypothetical protein